MITWIWVATECRHLSQWAARDANRPDTLKRIVNRIIYKRHPHGWEYEICTGVGASVVLPYPITR